MIKRAIQRVIRGWDDKYWWGHCDYHAKMTAEALDEMIKKCNGHPHEMTSREWKKILREMRDGFRAVEELGETIEPRKVKKLMEKTEKGLALYAKHYFDLWD